jgi:hypothetical protein
MMEKDRRDVQREAKLALKRVADKESELKSVRNYCEKTKASTRAGVERAHTLFVEAYRELGAQTAPFDKSRKRLVSAFLGGCSRSRSHPHPS